MRKEMHYHDRTVHTCESVRIPRFLDWETRPAAFKRYPHFYNRIPFDSLPLKEFWPLPGSVTEQRQKGDARYDLRTIPSAGALFPVELYLQIRGISGILEGLYHYEAATNSLVLLHPVERDGVEPYLGLKRFSGILFLLSSPWFRSAWKYQLRSFRYCLLDSGHQLGALEAACVAEDRPFALLTRFDQRGLAERMGMEEKEFLMAAALSGEEGSREVRPLSIELPHVLPTDYHEPWPGIVEAYGESVEKSGLTTSVGIHPPGPYETEGLRESILRRRSVRAFRKEEMEGEKLEKIVRTVRSPLPCEGDPPVHLYAVVGPRVKGAVPGLYKNGTLIREGDFMERAGYLCLEQRLGSDSGVTLFLTGRSEDYQGLMMKAGLMGHRLYLEATRQGLGVSGIGAYYDTEVQEFLETEEWILYALALGL